MAYLDNLGANYEAISEEQLTFKSKELLITVARRLRGVIPGLLTYSWDEVNDRQDIDSTDKHPEQSLKLYGFQEYGGGDDCTAYSHPDTGCEVLVFDDRFEIVLTTDSDGPSLQHSGPIAEMLDYMEQNFQRGTEATRFLRRRLEDSVAVVEQWRQNFDNRGAFDSFKQAEEAMREAPTIDLLKITLLEIEEGGQTPAQCADAIQADILRTARWHGFNSSSNCSNIMSLNEQVSKARLLQMLRRLK